MLPEESAKRQLPSALEGENPSVKLLWLWLRSQRAPCFLRRLEELGRLERSGPRLEVK
jgi:hypothetical protein